MKGKGFKAAEENEEDRFHAVGKINHITGEPLSAAVQATWTDAFSEAMVQLGAKNENIVAMTAAMLHPTGLGRFAAAYPDRTFDVGIAEQHMLTSAAGLARAGLHPVVAVYSTFLNRAFDQLLLDVAFHKCGVTVVLDRAGITGSDGASHNGMWDMTLTSIIPGLQLAAPRDQTRLEEALERAVTVDDTPTVIRFSKEKLPDDIPAVAHRGEGLETVDLVRVDRDARTLIVGYGQFVGLAMQVADMLSAQGVKVSVADPLWAVPISSELVKLAGEFDHVVTIEDNLVVGGMGQQLRAVVAESGSRVTMQNFGIPQKFLAHASRGQVLDELSLTPQAIAHAVLPAVLGKDSSEHDVSSRLEG